jgi:hypothetical protein
MDLAEELDDMPSLIDETDDMPSLIDVVSHPEKKEEDESDDVVEVVMKPDVFGDEDDVQPNLVSDSEGESDDESDDDSEDEVSVDASHAVDENTEVNSLVYGKTVCPRW